MPKKIIIANWKMHKQRREVAAYFDALQQAANDTATVYVAPPFTMLAEAVKYGTPRGIGVLAQNIHHATQGAFTGEISVAMIKELGVQGAIVGHSERRTLFGEDDALITNKVQACHNNALQPILCVGESDTERQQGATQTVLQRQLHGVLQAGTTLSIAYEPIWAIGTGNSASMEQVQDAHRYVKKLGMKYDCKLQVLYGGSVNKDNAASLLALPDVDGVLVGGASLDAKQFAAIIAAAS